MRKSFKVLFWIAFLPSLMFTESLPAKPYDRQKWLEDYELLKNHTAKYYANFETKIVAGFDPIGLDQKAKKMLEKSGSDQESFLAILRFIAAFEDGHYRLEDKAKAFNTYFGPKRDFQIKIIKRGPEFIYVTGDPKICSFAEGTAILTYNDKPIVEVFEKFLAWQSDYNVLAREDSATQNLSSGHHLPDDLILQSERGERCHFKAEVAPLPSKPDVLLTSETKSKQACKALGIIEEKSPIPSGIDRLTAYKPLANDSFPMGVVHSKGHIHFSAFGSLKQFRLCEREWNIYRKTFNGSCSENCRERFLYKHFWQVLSDELDKSLARLVEAGAKSLLVDLSGNGGGNNWVDIAARIIGPDKIRCPTMLFVNSDQVAEDLLTSQKEFSEDLRSASLEQSLAIKGALATAQTMLADRRKICKPRWPVVKSDSLCSNLIPTPRFSCGFVSYAPPGSLLGLKHASTLFNSADFHYKEYQFKGPVVLLVDRHTSSAAELFVSLIKSNVPKVKIVGEATNGTGCGYYNGGNPITLNHSGLRINMPSCVRLRHDGSNEAFGFSPDIKIDWRQIDATSLERELKTW